MLHACVQRFDVTGNLEKFGILRGNYTGPMFFLGKPSQNPAQYLELPPQKKKNHHWPLAPVTSNPLACTSKILFSQSHPSSVTAHQSAAPSSSISRQIEAAYKSLQVAAASPSVLFSLYHLLLLERGGGEHYQPWCPGTLDKTPHEQASTRPELLLIRPRCLTLLHPICMDTI